MTGYPNGATRALGWMLTLAVLIGAVPAAVAVFSLSTLLAMSNSILYGLQRYDITAKIKMGM